MSGDDRVQVDRWVRRVNQKAAEIDAWAATMHPSAWHDGLALLHEEFMELAMSGPGSDPRVGDLRRRAAELRRAAKSMDPAGPIYESVLEEADLLSGNADFLAGHFEWHAELDKLTPAQVQKQRKALLAGDPMPRLFIGCYPCGYVFSDKGRERDHDYVRLAFMSYETRVMAFEKDCPGYWRRALESLAATWAEKAKAHAPKGGEA